MLTVIMAITISKITFVILKITVILMITIMMTNYISDHNDKDNQDNIRGEYSSP